MNRWDEQAFERIYRDEDCGDLFYRAHRQLNLNLIDFQLVLDFLPETAENKAQNAALFLIVLHSLNEGSVCVNINLESFKEALNTLLDDSPEVIISSLDTNVYDDLISKDEFIVRPLLLQNHFLYLYRNFHLEQKLITNCHKLLDQSTVFELGDEFKNHFHHVIQSLPYKLHSRQLLGVICGVLNKFSIITGGPGTGKTSVLATLLRVLTRLPGEDLGKIRLVAPTGKAAQRMADSLKQSITGLKQASPLDLQIADLEASTIHRLIKSYLNEDNIKIDAQTLVIDEVSMVDSRLMANLLNALQPNCRVIFLGDKHQLPSVEAGQVLADLLPDKEPTYTQTFLELTKSLLGTDAFSEMNIQSSATNDPLINKVVLLTKSYRSSQEILDLSQYVNSDIDEGLRTYTLSSDLLLQEDSKLTEGLPLFEYKTGVDPYPENWFENKPSVQFFWENYPAESFYTAWFDQCFSYNKKSYLDFLKESYEGIDDTKLVNLFHILEDSRILCFTRAGEHGINRINQLGTKYFRKKLNEFNSLDVFHGAPIMITRNDYSRQLYNGDVGIVLKDPTGYRAYFAKEDIYVSYSIDLLRDYELSFAMTVHKSQGSEYGKVLLIVPENRDNRLLSREILYTGITRAKKNCVIAGDKTIFLEGAARKIIRESSGALWK